MCHRLTGYLLHSSGGTVHVPSVINDASVPILALPPSPRIKSQPQDRDFLLNLNRPIRGCEIIIKQTLSHFFTFYAIFLYLQAFKNSRVFRNSSSYTLAICLPRISTFLSVGLHFVILVSDLFLRLSMHFLCILLHHLLHFIFCFHVTKRTLK